MANKLERKCAHCKGVIEISKNNICGVLQFQKKYYHCECFKELAANRVSSKRGKPEIWRDALDNMRGLESDTKKVLEQYFAKDELNEWLLSNYNITAVPSTFWQRIADLECGIYRRKKCKPVSIATLSGAWKWGQRKLDEIARNNKVNHNGPKNDEERLIYDLAILIGKMSSYLAYKAKQDVAKVETKTNIVHINYDNIQKTEKSFEGLDDISALIDEF